MVQNTVSSKLTRTNLLSKNHLVSEACVKSHQEDTRLLQPTGDMFGEKQFHVIYKRV